MGKRGDNQRGNTTLCERDLPLALLHDNYVPSVPQEFTAGLAASPSGSQRVLQS